MSRHDIYYWKSDRPAAFHGTHQRTGADAQIESPLREELCRHFGTTDLVLSPGCGQGNHLTWNAEIAGLSLFIRVENGPERDGQLAIESQVLDRVRSIGVSTPRVHGCDASRQRVPFAWQALERIDARDLNHWWKQGTLDIARIPFQIGAAVASWQQITLTGFGPLAEVQHGYHDTYAAYFELRIRKHLDFLVEHAFLKEKERDGILTLVSEHAALLRIEAGCLVHKDLALWNVLGTPSDVIAFIDFDDAVSGDPLDDLSLLGCFHDARFLEAAFAGYQSRRVLPNNFQRRFWLHLLRNMLVKSVIRVGAGYFDRTDNFFLFGSGMNGAGLREMTRHRLLTAITGLRDDLPIDRINSVNISRGHK